MLPGATFSVRIVRGEDDGRVDVTFYPKWKSA